MTRALLALTLVLFATLVLSASIFTPTSEAPDEIAHDYFVQYLWLNRTLPVMQLDHRGLGNPQHEFFQPPASYVAALLTALPAGPDLGMSIAYQPNPIYGFGSNSLDNNNKNTVLHGHEEVFPFEQTARAAHMARLSSVVLGVDVQNNRVAQRDTFSGGGMFPTSLRSPGKIAADTMVSPVRPDAPAPRAYYLAGGLWDLATGGRLPATGSDPGAHPYRLGRVAVVPAVGQQGLPSHARSLDVALSSGVRLRGCAPPPAGSREVSLFWQSTEALDRDYKIFVHAWDGSGTFIAGVDHAPDGSGFPARYWRAGDWIVDTFDAPDRDDSARIDVGPYAGDSQQRLAVVDPPQPDGIVSLPTECWRP